MGPTSRSLRATVERLLDHPRLAAVYFHGSPQEIWAGFARDGRPIQYAHVPRPLAIYDTWSSIAANPAAFEPPSAGFVLSWGTIAALAARGVDFATLTHAAGLSSSGDPRLDARFPLDEPYNIPDVTAEAISRARMRGNRIVAVGTTVVRALEDAAWANGNIAAGAGLARLPIEPTSSATPCSLNVMRRELGCNNLRRCVTPVIHFLRLVDALNKMMHFKLLRLAAACALLSLAACGGGGNDDPPETFQTQILSDSGFDGDIEQTGPDTAIVTQGMGPGVQEVLAGIDPATGDEFRAFLHFPLGGTNGVPANARIDSAFLEVFINELQPTDAVVPVRVELVSFEQPMLATDFDRTAQPPLAYTILSPRLGPSDVGKYVPIDVTGLMIEAQRRGLADFQVRILEDLGPPIDGLFWIDDATGANRSKTAPLLTVTYF